MEPMRPRKKNFETEPISPVKVSLNLITVIYRGNSAPIKSQLTTRRLITADRTLKNCYLQWASSSETQRKSLEVGYLLRPMMTRSLTPDYPQLGLTLIMASLPEMVFPLKDSGRTKMGFVTGESYVL